MFQWYYAKIDEKDLLQKLNFFLPYVSKERRYKVQMLCVGLEKKISLYSELLVRTVLCTALQIKNNDLVFGKQALGKPFLKTNPALHFNLSHSSNTIAVSVSDDPVGIDIEKLKAADFRIAQRFFTPREWSYISKSNQSSDNRFFEIWTKKEAYVKYTGKGLSIPLHSFDVMEDFFAKQIQTWTKDDSIISICGRNAQHCFVDGIEMKEQAIEDQILTYSR